MQLILNESDPKITTMTSNSNKDVKMDVVENHVTQTEEVDGNLMAVDDNGKTIDINPHTSTNVAKEPDEIEVMDIDSLSLTEHSLVNAAINPPVNDVMVFFADCENDSTINEKIKKETSDKDNLFTSNIVVEETNVKNESLEALNDNEILDTHGNPPEENIVLDVITSQNGSTMLNENVLADDSETCNKISSIDETTLIENSTPSESANVSTNSSENISVHESSNNTAVDNNSDNKSPKENDDNACEVKKEPLENGINENNEIVSKTSSDASQAEMIFKKEQDENTPDSQENCPNNTCENTGVSENNIVKQEILTSTDMLIESSEKSNDSDSEMPCDNDLFPMENPGTLLASQDPLQEPNSTVDAQNIKPEIVKTGVEKTSNESDSSFELLLSDDEVVVTDKQPDTDISKKVIQSENKSKEKECVSIDDDDDIVLICEDNSAKNDVEKSDKTNSTSTTSDSTVLPETHATVLENDVITNNETGVPLKPDNTASEKSNENVNNYMDTVICPLKIMKKIKPSLGEMSREDLEEFCVVKIVESISGRSAISDLQLKIKSHEKSMEEWRKKVISLNKQNKDLQIVLKTVCEEQQKRAKDNPTPIKITRSVGLQVGYPAIKSSSSAPNNTTTNTVSKPIETVTPPPLAPISATGKRGRPKTNLNSTSQPPTPTTQPSTPKSTGKKNTSVPVPRLVPNPSVSTPTPKSTSKTASAGTTTPPTSNNNGNMLKTVLLQPSPDISKAGAEKRPAIQSIDLTDDEPPAKVPALKPNHVQTSPRALNPQQNTNPNRVTYVVNTTPNAASPRPVYISINQGKNSPHPSPMIVGARKPVPQKVNIPPLRPFVGAQPIRFGQPIPIRAPGIQLQHPAPLPQSINPKNQMHTGWKWIPPRPTLKIARVDNGIVISWEMDDFSEPQHEPIASYQIFAYQEASTHPTSDLWKKIGDVKALPLPMACTLTHFMAGFKYYFAVRALDIRSRVGPFSAPGQITLVNNKK